MNSSEVSDEGHLRRALELASRGSPTDVNPLVGAVVTDAAGAVADNSTLARSLKFGARFLEESLNDNDSYSFFNRLGDLIVTGPTRTNVMDLHLVLVG